jgi:hypothetical protein
LINQVILKWGKSAAALLHCNLSLDAPCRRAIINILRFNTVDVRDCNVGYATFVDKELGSNACHMEMPFQGLRKSVVNIF